MSLDEDRAGVAKSGSAMAAQWFKQDLFADPNLLDDDDEEAGAGEDAADKRPAKKARTDGAEAAPAKGKKAVAAHAEEDEEPVSVGRATRRGGIWRRGHGWAAC